MDRMTRSTVFTKSQWKTTNCPSFKWWGIICPRGQRVVCSPKLEGYKHRCRISSQLRYFQQSKATIPSLENFYFWIPKAVIDFLIRGFLFFFFTAITFGYFFSSLDWKLVWGCLKRNYLRDAGAHDLELNKYFIKKISLLCCKDKKKSLLCKFF